MSNDKCRWCGAPITFISRSCYERTAVDPEAVYVVPDENGLCFIRVDGSKIRGREVDAMSEEAKEPAYRPHKLTCGYKGR